MIRRIIAFALLPLILLAALAMPSSAAIKPQPKQRRPAIDQRCARARLGPGWGRPDRGGCSERDQIGRTRRRAGIHHRGETGSLHFCPRPRLQPHHQGHRYDRLPPTLDRSDDHLPAFQRQITFGRQRGCLGRHRQDRLIQNHPCAKRLRRIAHTNLLPQDGHNSQANQVVRPLAFQDPGRFSSLDRP